MTYVWIALATYAALGVASVVISYPDLVPRKNKWWAWTVVGALWPVWWFHLFRGR